MKCPYCADENSDDRSVRALHAHLADAHAEEITTAAQGDRTLYVVTCPYCGAQHRQPIKKSAGDAEFLDEFAHQIRLVAFDMLLNHVLAEHDPEQLLS
ncbi:MAG: hypothetical protein L0K86_10630 [Actinomycetia bacterium]|nr:hypothetical protein [Actinomycetes bacterium]